MHYNLVRTMMTVSYREFVNAFVQILTSSYIECPFYILFADLS